MLSMAEKVPATHKEWLKEDGGIEHPSRVETFLQACQVKRILWLKEHAKGNVLEMGSNWGFVLNEVMSGNGSQGWAVDVNSENIEKGRKEFPHLCFVQGDITQILGIIFHDSFDTVMLPDVLEHIDFDKVPFVVEQACLLAKDRVLITLPQEHTKVHCFKHKWIVTAKEIRLIGQLLKKHCWNVHTEFDGDFYYMIGSLNPDERLFSDG